MGRRWLSVALAAALAPAPALAAGEDGAAQAPAEPAAGAEPAKPAKVPGTRTLRLSLGEAVAMSLKNNLDLRVSSYEPSIAGATVREAESLYEHLFTARVEGGERKFPVASRFSGDGTEVSDDLFGASAGLRRLLPTGGSLSLEASLDRTLTNATTYQINPYYESSLGLTLRQPLLRSAGREFTESGIRIAKDSRDLADLSLRNRTEDLVRRVESSYWALVGVRGDVEAQAKSVAVAEDLLRITEARLAAGAGTRVDVSQAAAGVAARHVDLLRARNTLRSVEENLLGLLLPRASDGPGEEDLRFEPADKAEAGLPPLPTEDPGAAVAAALAGRSDIRAQKVLADQAQVAVLQAESGASARLDFEAGLSYGGVGHNAGDSYADSLASRQWPTWTVGLVLEVPIGNRAARARLERAFLERARTEAGVRALESNAAVSVRNARRDLESAREQIDASRRATALAEEQLEAEKERLRNDKSTTFEVLRLESDLTNARRSELRALVDYRTSVVRYDFELGRILEARGLAK